MLLALHQVRKRYGSHLVLRDISLRLSAGQICRVHGANGSGKSTLLRIVAGLSLCDSGRIERHGAMAYVGHEDALLADCTVAQNLTHLARLDPLWRSAALDAHIHGLHLEPMWHKKVRTLSQGTRRKVGLLLQLGSGAPLLLADEPFAGLDARSADYVRGGYRARLAEGAALLWTHHGADALDAGSDSLQLEAADA